MSLQRYLGKRLVEMVPVVIGVTVLVFLIARLAPGDPAYAILGGQATEEAVRHINQKWGLNQPLHIQYVKWLFNAIQGDLGTSIAFNIPVTDVLVYRSVRTFHLMVSSMIISVFIGVPFGIYSAVKRNTSLDSAIRITSLVFVSVPRFWSALMLILLFAFLVPIFPQGGLPLDQGPIVYLQHIFLPALTLGLYYSAYITRMMRSNMLDELGKDYIETAHAMGIEQRTIYFKDAAKNAFIPTFTIIGLTVAYILNGTVMVEVIYNIPGIGQTLVSAVFNRDYPLIQGVVLYISMIFVSVNLLTDVLYAYIDPRIKY